jgi:hypothetical protein
MKFKRRCSKRQSLSKQYKIERKIKQHRKKLKKVARKSGHA